MQRVKKFKSFSYLLIWICKEKIARRRKHRGDCTEKKASIPKSGPDATSNTMRIQIKL
uniref:Uncharacterized protein n=1 Tax=Solanum tuberosum TaxID=4113 RepID=M1AFZ5_SOLTU